MSRRAAGEGRFKRLLCRIGHFQSGLLLTILYLLLWIPAGLLSRLLVDWLRRKPPAESCWLPRAERVNRAETLRDPF